MDLRAKAEALLRTLTGNAAASFHHDQWEAIDALVGQRATVLVVQRTGWGKSAVYFIATRLLRDAGAGPTLLISPLLALMRNQIQMAERAGVRAATINSANVEDWEAIEARVRAGEIDLLLISPERFNNDRFRHDLMPDVTASVGLLVVDEAHCISDWGHDFRPDYRRIARVLPMLPRGVPVLCTTATANDRVVADIVEQAGHDLVVLRGPLDRESLHLAVVDLPAQADRLAWLATAIPQLPGSGIVYCLTVADTRRVADWLTARGIDAVAYSGDTDTEARLDIEDRLLANDVKVVVATSALGMGFDKPDLAFVVHFQSPGSAIAYYQQVGRAGRGLDHAVGVLCCGSEDADIQDYFIRTAFPPRDQAEQVVALLAERDEPASIGDIETVVNARRSRIEAMLKVLEVEGVVERAGGRWSRTAQPWEYPAARVEAVTALRRAEQEAMRSYAASDGCRMELLRRELDDPDAARCGRCDNCTDTHWTMALDPALVRAARAHLRSAVLVIEPRRKWPPGVGSRSNKKVDAAALVEPGRALGIENDGGWGSAVRRARDDATLLPDDVVTAAADLIRRWAPDAAPTWVTCVPSARAPLVADAARRLADALGLEFRSVVRRTRDAPPQREMENSTQQARNVLGAFTVGSPVPSGPVLLVDDLVDSRWTFTAVGALLRDAGSGPVLPFAFAQARGG
jgi:ATP-dependent DNA helicase RecQ